MTDWIDFSPELEPAAKKRFRSALRLILGGATDQARSFARTQKLDIAASVHLLCDLVEHGWELRLGPPDVKRKRAQIRRASERDQSDETRNVVRKQHLRARDEQLSKEPVRTFIKSMEHNRNHKGSFVSVFSLMRDGGDLAKALRKVHEFPAVHQAEALNQFVRPYLQLVAENTRCDHTGFLLGDIWRYFRHTWASHHASVPGRSMAFLVRDEAAPYHPVIGIGALGSAVVQSTVRDKWLGWIPSDVVEALRVRPTKVDADWMCSMVSEFLDSVYVEDFLEDGVLKSGEIQKPTQEAISRLNEEAKRSKKQHQVNYEPDDHRRSRSTRGDDHWQRQARTDLFRSKRAEMLSMLLEARQTLEEAFQGKPTAAGLSALLETGHGRKIVGRLIHRKKAESVGVNIADITVCGALPPYSHLVGGKLVAMLACSPEIVVAYKERYRSAASIIASSMAGREIVRKPHLVALSTTSLFGVVPNQYTRLSIPANVCGQGSGESVKFEELGVTLGYGTFHLTNATRETLWKLVQQKQSRAAVNWVFGEGVNPRLRGLRDGIDVLGLPSDEILNHGSSKVVYGVLLARNATEILLGKRTRPEYRLWDDDPKRATAAISAHWATRWLASRITRDDILERVARETLSYPIRHGARVVLPLEPGDGSRQYELFE